MFMTPRAVLYSLHTAPMDRCEVSALSAHIYLISKNYAALYDAQILCTASVRGGSFTCCRPWLEVGVLTESRPSPVNSSPRSLRIRAALFRASVLGRGEGGGGCFWGVILLAKQSVT